jgi:hypothetical protein
MLRQRGTPDFAYYRFIFSSKAIHSTVGVPHSSKPAGRRVKIQAYSSFFSSMP